MSLIEPGLPWYAIHFRSRAESTVTSVLTHHGYEHFYPTYGVTRRWSDRVKTFHQPLFPGYLFCRLDPVKRLPVLMMSGVIGIVGAGGQPMPVDAAEIEAIRAALQSGLRVQPWPFLKVGETVYVAGGPLVGLEGIVVRISNHLRMVISVTLLQRSVAVDIEQAWVRPTSPTRAAAVSGSGG